MAFGLGFNKAKILNAAEKYVIQGKISAAIGEYSKILDKDPKDLMILNTVGDLHVRTGNTQEALRCFYDLAEKFVEGGFVPRGTAVYKRIAKIDPNSVQAFLKLGELYALQGLMRDSRFHYLQAVEFYLRQKDKEKARQIFEKIVLTDPLNPKLQLRLAELYADTAKKEDAIATYLGAAERFLDSGQIPEAVGALDSLFRLEPEHPGGKTLLGRACLEEGDLDKAEQSLLAIPALVSHKDALNLLFHVYTKQENAEKAREIAIQLFDLHEDFAGLAQIAEQYVDRDEYDQALNIYQGAVQRLIAQRGTSALIQGLRKILALQSSHIGTLQLMLDVLKETGNRGEIRETMELLAHAYVTEGNLEKARDLYAEMVAAEPENRDHRRLLQQVEVKLRGGAVPEEATSGGAEPDAAMAAELAEPMAPTPETQIQLSPAEQEIVRNCLTESEIFITYRQLTRAIEVLEQGLSRLPGNITLSEHLLPLYEQSRFFRKAAECCESLMEAYVKAGDGDRAFRCGEWLASYQRKAAESESQQEDAVSLLSEAEEMQEAPTAPPAMPAESQVREVDLSMEWASLASGEEPSAPAQDSVVEEIEFYLQAGLLSDTQTAISNLEQRSPGHPGIAGFRERLADLQGEPTSAAAESAPDASPVETTPGEIVFDVSDGVAEAALEEEAGTGIPALEEAAEAIAEASEESSAPVEEPEAAPAPPAEPELVLEDILAAPELSSSPGAFELTLEEPAAPAVPSVPSGDPLSALVEEVSAEVELPAAPPQEESPVVPVAAASSPVPAEASPATPAQKTESPLDEIFAEFQEGVEGEAESQSEDVETHYNMGVAFKEMALYDEAIGEFQKVHQLAEKAGDFSHAVQCCSLLAICFQEKGLPQLAVQWLQTALHIPGLDSESSLALLYEMASAHEKAGDHEAARQRFLEVYARNIDYRDVAERIRSLEQTQ